MDEVETGQVGQTYAHGREALHWLANAGSGSLDFRGFAFSMFGFALNSLAAMGSGATQANSRKLGKPDKYGPTDHTK
jgi:hypothetical protein